MPETDSPLDPKDVAEEAGLRYVEDGTPGISRRPCGRGFTYLQPDGQTLRDPGERDRIENLAIPPAWTDVWICRHPDGHILATGRDDRERKQYRYHPRWQDMRRRVRFERVLAFGRALPGLRSRVGRQLRAEEVDLAKVRATAVRLLDRTGIRVGHAEYAERNGTVGLTSLCGRHVHLSGSRIGLNYTGKGGVEISTIVRDEALARALEHLMKRSEDSVFSWNDGEDGEQTLRADDLNAWLRDTLHPTCSAKDFRTWRATVEVIDDLVRTERPAADERLGRYLGVVDRAAELLSNTRSVVRSSYLPPGLEALYTEGPFSRVAEQARARGETDVTPGRTREERVAIPVLAYLVVGRGENSD